MRKYFSTFSSLQFFLYGLLMPLAFAPFHLPGMAFISLALLYWALEKKVNDHVEKTGTKRFTSFFMYGFLYGLGYFGFGVSWVAVSMIRYGHFHPLLAGIATGLFVSFLSIYSALFCMVYRGLYPKIAVGYRILLFASLWTITEYIRAKLFTGFPWLLTGQAQIDSFFKPLLPVLGIYGTGFLTALSAALIAHCMIDRGLKRLRWIGGLSAFTVIPQLIDFKDNNIVQEPPFSVGIVQGNIAMRDKWDETLFWQMLKQYQDAIQTLYGTKLIVLPESALPLPAAYILSILNEMSQQAKKEDTAILMGIPDVVPNDEERYYNTLTSLGHAKGNYYKQHLVPFGEYIPAGFSRLIRWINYPEDSLKKGQYNQSLIRIHSQRAATLICYEIAFGELLRKQLPGAGFIVTVSDNGWFGHSLAIYQHRQIAQVYSLMSQRYQILANNDGLSSIIDQNGNIVDQLPPWTSGILKSSIKLNFTLTPWARYGETPALICSAIIILFCTTRKFRKLPDEKAKS